MTEFRRPLMYTFGKQAWQVSQGRTFNFRSDIRNLWLSRAINPEYKGYLVKIQDGRKYDKVRDEIFSYIDRVASLNKE